MPFLLIAYYGRVIPLAVPESSLAMLNALILLVEDWDESASQVPQFMTIEYPLFFPPFSRVEILNLGGFNKRMRPVMLVRSAEHRFSQNVEQV